MTRFDPDNAHAWGLSNHGAIRGSGELDGDQTTQRKHRILPRFGPLGGKKPTSCLSDFIAWVYTAVEFTAVA
jgi:hypothetical protein